MGLVAGRFHMLQPPGQTPGARLKFKLPIVALFIAVRLWAPNGDWTPVVLCAGWTGGQGVKGAGEEFVNLAVTALVNQA